MSKSMDEQVEVTIKEEDMYQFMLHCEYKRVMGIVYLLISITCLVLFPFSLIWGDTALTLLLLAGGLFHTLFTPLSLKLKAKRQVLMNEAYKEPFLYTINEDGLVIEQKENKFEYQWEELLKVVQTKTLVLFFLNKRLAFIMPIRNCEESIEDILSILKEQVPEKKLNLR
ncbi:YcxB-like protein [Natranaerovirga hydrolytica]|uniref:YcxB-like protein n=1 Tax=Natranaerovirga hydrolytica TaxID=680378 RepID=A0A4R1M958_9FIRM|nr:YcxB family protein [Natranaerovirga hydrolytica]TCK87942.1 YcxB-like protein [Natranaerovirga hydrolytica]